MFENVEINNTKIKKILMVFLIIQPLLDLSCFYSNQVISLFKFSPSTIIRMIMIVVMFTLVYFNKKHDKQEKLLYVYFAISCLYFIFHHLNSLNFSANITSTLNYSFAVEIFYFIRMLMPILLIYVVMNVGITRNDIKKIVYSVVLIYSSVIILSSLFKFGIASYGGGSIKYSILDWFKYDSILVNQFATQGLFEGANRLGVLLSALFPITNFFYFIDKKNKDIVVIALQIIALLIIGTKVATYTWIMVCIIMIVLYLLFSSLKIKLKFNLKKLILYILVIFLCAILMSYSPVLTSKQYSSDKSSAINEEEKSHYYDKVEMASKLEGEEKIDALSEIIKNDTGYLWIHKIYILTLYNYKLDPDFWLEYMKNPFNVRHNDRITQSKIIQRIIDLNENPLDYFFGIGYSRFRSSKIYLERDYVMQSYSMGIIGCVLLLGVFIVTLFISAFYIIKEYKRQFRFELFAYCCSLCIFVFTSIICGHVFDEMITYIFIALICGKILEQVYYPKKSLCKDRVEEKISIIVPVYNVDCYLEKCFESILKQNVSDMEVIVINDASTDNSLKICEKYAKENGFILINNKKNSGPAISRNKGIKKATGDYIIFVDSDDILYDDCISILYNVAKKENSDIVIAGINSFDKNGKYGYYSDKYINEYKTCTIFENKKLVNCISICSKIYKTSLIKTIKFLENTYHEDNSFTLTSFFKASRMTVIPKHLYYRRIRESNNSIMQTLDYNKYLDLIKNYEAIINDIKTNKNIDFLFKYMSRKICNYILKNVSFDKRKDALSKAKQFLTNYNRKMIVYFNTYYALVNIPYTLYIKIRNRK